MGVINIKIEWWRRGPLKKCSKSAAKSDEKWNRVLEALFQNVFLLLLGLSYSSPFRGARREPQLKIQGLKKGPKWTIFNVFCCFWVVFDHGIDLLSFLTHCHFWPRGQNCPKWSKMMHFGLFWPPFEKNGGSFSSFWTIFCRFGHFGPQIDPRGRSEASQTPQIDAFRV